MASCTADYISIGYRPFDQNELWSDEIAQHEGAQHEGKSNHEQSHPAGCFNRVED